MNILRRLSLSKKLMAVTMLVTVVAMMAGFVAVIVNDYQKLKNNALERSQLIARTVGNYSAVDIAFLDHASAVETLSYLKTTPSVISADIFDLKKNHFVSLQSAPADFAAPNGVSSWHLFKDNTICVVEAIRDKGRDFGYIQVSFSTTSLLNEFLSNIFSMLLVLAALLMMAYFLAVRLQRIASDPLLQLADASRTVARNADFSVRVHHDADDEVGTLYSAFNNLLQQVEQREYSQNTAQSALRQSEEQWRSIAEYSPDYIMRIDELGNILFINRSFPERGKPKSVELNIFSLFSMDSHSVMEDAHGYVWETGKSTTYTAVYSTPKGDIYFEANVGPVFHESSVVALTISARDISDRLQTEEALSRFRTALDSSDDNIFLIDPQEMKFVDFNLAAVQDLGYTRMELLAMGPHDLKPFFNKDDLQKVFQKVIESNDGIGEVSTVHRRKDGSEFHAEIRFNVWRPEGEAPLIIALARDIGERLKAEVEILKLSRAVEQTTNTIIITNADGVIEYVNPAFTLETGFSASEAIGKTPGILASGETPHEVYLDLWETISNGDRWQGELLNRKKDGDTYWELAAISPIKDENDNITHYLGIQIDISQRRQTEAELANYRDHLEELVKGRTKELEEVNKELEAFAYSVSHDLRAPLRAIDGFSRILLEDYAEVMDEGAQSYLKRIGANADKMARLIDDILELSRLGRAELKMTTVDLSGIADEVVQTLREGEIEREVSVSIQAGLVAQGDATLLKVVMMNLLGNAWKYSSSTAHANIEFGTAHEQDETVYFVKDNGAGFDEQYAHKLFAVFQRLHSASEFEGSGVGLATVARIIHRHQGRVWGEGKVGAGATFFFSLGR